MSTVWKEVWRSIANDFNSDNNNNDTSTVKHERGKRKHSQSAAKSTESERSMITVINTDRRSYLRRRQRDPLYLENRINSMGATMQLFNTCQSEIEKAELKLFPSLVSLLPRIRDEEGTTTSVAAVSSSPLDNLLEFQNREYSRRLYLQANQLVVNPANNNNNAESGKSGVDRTTDILDLIDTAISLDPLNLPARLRKTLLLLENQLLDRACSEFNAAREIISSRRSVAVVSAMAFHGCTGNRNGFSADVDEMIQSCSRRLQALGKNVALFQESGISSVSNNNEGKRKSRQFDSDEAQRDYELLIELPSTYDKN